MSSSNNDTKILSEQYSSIYKEGTGSGSAESRYDEPYRKAERAKFDDPGHRQLQQRMQAEYDKKKADQGDEAPEDNDPWGETDWESQTRTEETPDTLLNGGKAGNEDYTGINDLVKHFMQTNFPAEEYDELQKMLKLTHAYLMDYKEWAESKGL
jgi:hypothetical protein